MKQSDINRVTDIVIDRIGNAADIIELIEVIETSPDVLVETIKKEMNDAGFYR